MDNFYKKLILVLCFFYSFDAWSENNKISIMPESENLDSMSEVELGWDQIKDAESYEIEFKDTKGKSKIIKSQETTVKTELSCGTYTFRARTINRKKIVGEWGVEQSLEIPIKTPLKIIPEDKKEIASNEKEKANVTFRWGSTGSESYRLEVYDSKEKLVSKLVTSKLKAELKLTVGKKYTWKVISSRKGCQTEEDEKEWSFAIYGALPSPVISQKKYEISWKKDPFVETYDYTIEKEFEDRAGKVKGWKVEETETNTDSTYYKITRKLTLGKYRINVVAKGPLRVKSPPSVFYFSYDKPLDLESRVEFSAGYMMVHKNLKIAGKGLAANFDGYILANYILGASFVYKNIGLNLDYEEGEKTVYFRNQVTRDLVFFKLKSNRYGISLSYDYLKFGIGISTKLSLSSEELNAFSLQGPIVEETSESTKIMGIEVGPKFLIGPIQYYVFASYDSLLSSKPFKITPYTQYGFGVHAEKFLGDYLAAGLFFRYGYISYTYTDNEDNLFTNTSKFQKMGFYVKAILH